MSWIPEKGYFKLPGSDGRYPNGISAAKDGKSYFVNLYLDNEVRQHDMHSGEVMARWDVTRPDNSAWTEEGKLWVASHTGSLTSVVRAMSERDGTPSYLPFAVVEIDPQTSAQREVLHREGPPMGLATVAIKQGNSVYLGSFLGDRIIQIPLVSE